MERNKHIQYLAAICLGSFLGLTSCSNDEYDEPQPTKDEISFTASEWTSVEARTSRASIYKDSLSLLNPSIGGGNFTVSAYVTGTGQTYFKDARVWFFSDPMFNKWTFLDANDDPMAYYWPNSSNLNFFAYMPNRAYDGKDGYQSKETHVELGEYSDQGGQKFTCNLPEKVDLKTEMQEFIYAYATNQKKTKEDVKLKFYHPFSLINFKIGVDSYRMTIKSLQLDGIYLAGEFSTVPEVSVVPDENSKTGMAEIRGQWTPDKDAGLKTYTMGLGKRIPNETNYNTLLFDNLIVMPQKSDEVTLTVNFDRYNEETKEDDILNQTVTAKLPINWLQGRRYTYTLRIGDNKNEIHFNVLVEEDWIPNGITNVGVE
ncbi:MAG: fimbrillin family protein [Clostridium sp.]|nr:fimbrillin family protein [Clostridium sp.]